MSGSLKFYQEHPIFDACTRFDPATGKLTAIDQNELNQVVSKCHAAGTDINGIQRYESEGVTVFSGDIFRTRTRFPRRVYFQITRNCNLECSYCFLKSRRGLPHVPVDAVDRLVRFLGRHGLMEVRLTGGEPTTHPSFLHILDAFRENGIYVSVATNGMVSQRTLDALAEREHLWIICSVDGNRETHDTYRPNTFNRIVSNLRYLKERSPTVRLRLTTVLTKRNKGQIRDIARIAKSVDAESITVIPLRPQVRNPSVLAEMVTAQEFLQVLEEIVSAVDEVGVPITTTLATRYEARIHKDPIVRKRAACAAGREATNIDFDSEKQTFMVYGCSYSPAPDVDSPPAIRKPFIAGEFPAHSVEQFLTIWQDDSAWTIYRNEGFKAAECHACHYYTQQQCVGSCPIQNIDYGAIKADADVLAQLRSQLSRTMEWYCYKEIAG